MIRPCYTERRENLLRKLLGNAEDVAKAVLNAITQSIDVNIAEIVVWPPKALNL